MNYAIANFYKVDLNEALKDSCSAVTGHERTRCHEMVDEYTVSILLNDYLMTKSFGLRFST